VVGHATRASRDPRRAVAGEARDAVDTRGLDRFSEGHRRQDGGESACQHPGADPTLWGWAPFHLSSDSKQRGAPIFCLLCQNIWGFVIFDPTGLIMLANGPALPGTPDVMWPISTEESGECAFASSLEVDFTGGDTTVALGPRGEGYVTIPRDPLVACAPLGAARGGGSSRRRTGWPMESVAPCTSRLGGSGR
jgi:hypothetical protein